MNAKLQLFISKVKCFFGKHVLDFENETEHHCYCRKKYVRKPLPKATRAEKELTKHPKGYVTKPKKKVVKKVFLPKCPTQGKISRTEKEAKEVAYKKGLRAYKCAWCSNWHLTHKKDKMKMH